MVQKYNCVYVDYYASILYYIVPSATENEGIFIKRVSFLGLIFKTQFKKKV